MARVKLDSALTAMGALTFLLIWGVIMVLKGTLATMLRAAWNGGFANGDPLQTVYTGILPVDFLFRFLMTMFAPLTHLRFLSGYLMLAELTVMILVFNMVAIVESQRADRSSLLRFPLFWNTGYNWVGVAVAQPFFARSYVRLDAHKRVQPLPRAYALALPATTILNWATILFMLLPAWTSLPTIQAHRVIVLYFFPGPLVILGFQALATRALASSPKALSSITNPVSATYLLNGLISAAAHLAILIHTVAAPDAGLRRSYVPDFAAVQPGQVDTFYEGTHLFIQIDVIVTALVVLILGAVMLGDAGRAQTGPAGGSFGVLVAISLVLGPGAGMAYAAYAKERSIERAVAAKSL
ncbi:hypothetical protein VPNG_09629 [Cytospora leucostoma]|uniref:Uncharacterized protein n=1 Tax=Cytospora leucostoma TaxID=1230097 RepID=A0A423VQW1_9PEZI|nr:hypothetical protein VPNG_09629 [Cytospora leucostoma]